VVVVVVVCFFCATTIVETVLYHLVKQIALFSIHFCVYFFKSYLRAKSKN